LRRLRLVELGLDAFGITTHGRPEPRGLDLKALQATQSRFGLLLRRAATQHGLVQGYEDGFPECGSRLIELRKRAQTFGDLGCERGEALDLFRHAAAIRGPLKRLGDHVQGRASLAHGRLLVQRGDGPQLLDIRGESGVGGLQLTMQHAAPVA